MRKHLFKLLKQQLLVRGFKRTYVNNLIDELWDHHECIVEELKFSGLTDKEAQQKALDQLGKEELILAEVLARKELMPIPKRHPLFTFIVLPIALIILGILIVLVGPISIIDGFSPDMETEEMINSGIIDLLKVLTFIIAYLIPPIAMVLFCYLADRFAVSLKWLAASAGIISMIGSMLVVKLYYPGSPDLAERTLTNSDTLPDRELLLGGGFWSDIGANYISFVIPILLFLTYVLLRRKQNKYTE